jgi:hypothetical protein
MSKKSVTMFRRKGVVSLTAPIPSTELQQPTTLGMDHMATVSTVAAILFFCMTSPF